VLFGTTITRASMLRVQEHTLDENSQRQGHRRVSAKPTLLANRDARTEVTSFQIYNFKGACTDWDQ